MDRNLREILESMSGEQSKLSVESIRYVKVDDQSYNIISKYCQLNKCSEMIGLRQILALYEAREKMNNDMMGKKGMPPLSDEEEKSMVKKVIRYWGNGHSKREIANYTKLSFVAVDTIIREYNW